MTATSAPPVHEIDLKDIEQLLRRATQGPLNSEDRELIGNMAMSYLRFSTTLADKNATIGKLRKALFGGSSEKTKQVLKQAEDATKPPASQENADSGETQTPQGADEGASDEPTPEPKRDLENKPSQVPVPKKGHGRNGVDSYEEARRIPVPHDLLTSGSACPCCKGRI